MFLLYWTKLFRRKDIAHRDTATKCLDIVNKLNRPIIIKKVSPTKVTRKFYEASVTILAEMWDLFDISIMDDRNIQPSYTYAVCIFEQQVLQATYNTK